MGKGKLAKFADMETYENMKGKWHEQYFKNQNPIVLELGCGKGEYTVELAKLYPNMNFIGVDIKGARMWTGATQAIRERQKNVAFLRTNIEIIDRFFAEDEVQEIWLTFSDPQMKNPRKRLTSTFFMNRYRHFLSLYHDDRIDDATKKILSIQTYYESMWIARGLNIKYMKWHLPRLCNLEEPDVEIELDDYRSYHRTKRSSLDKAK